MLKMGWRHALLMGALGSCAALPAAAATVTFEDVQTGLNSIYESGQSFASGGFQFGVSSGFLPPAQGALIGQVGDASSTFAPPTNVSGNFYQGYNDGWVTLTTGAAKTPYFKLEGFDFSFLAFLPGFYVEGDLPGSLVLVYQEDNGATGVQTFDFSPSDADGNFAFSTVSGTGLAGLQKKTFASVSFFACLNEVQGCVNPSTFNDAWFALDNISVSAVPEPSMAVLLALAVAGGLGASRRRRGA